MPPARHPTGRAPDQHADPDLAASLKRLASPGAASRLAAVAAEWAARRPALPEPVRARFPAALIPELPAAPGPMLSKRACWRRVLSKRARWFCSYKRLHQSLSLWLRPIGLAASILLMTSISMD